jgi:DNA polymerase III gamma/tau subunit
MRDSISLLDQIVTNPEEEITLELAQRILGTANNAAVNDLVEAIIRQDAAEGLHVINLAIDSGSDPRQFGQQVVEHLRRVLLTQTATAGLVEASNEEQQIYQQQAEQISRGMLLRSLRIFNEAVNEYRGGWQPQLSLELAFIDSIRGKDEIYVAPEMTSQQLQSVPVAPQVEATPNIPAVVSPGEVSARWGDMLHLLGQKNATAPAVVEQFRVVRVDGNVVVIGANSEIYVSRLKVPEKVKLVEWALSNVHRVPLRVDIVLSNTDTSPAGASNIDMNDSLLEEARKLGAEIHPFEDKRKE